MMYYDERSGTFKKVIKKVPPEFVWITPKKYSFINILNTILRYFRLGLFVPEYLVPMKNDTQWIYSIQPDQNTYKICPILNKELHIGRFTKPDDSQYFNSGDIKIGVPFGVWGYHDSIRIHKQREEAQAYVKHTHLYKCINEAHQIMLKDNEKE